MTLTWSGDLGAVLKRVHAESLNLGDDVAHGADVILKDAVDRAPEAPKKDGDPHPHLKTTGKVNKTVAPGTASITFAGPYASWVHEHLWFQHPHGGTAKFLELALLAKGQEAIKAAGNHFWRRLR